MHDEMAVGVGHGVADLKEESDPLPRVGAARRALLEQVPALDVLHGEIGTAVRRRAAVEEPGDVGMIEAGEDLPLRPKPPQDEVRVHPSPHELDRGPQAESRLVADAEVDGAHASVADLALDVPAPDAGRRRSLGLRARCGGSARRRAPPGTHRPPRWRRAGSAPRRRAPRRRAHSRPSHLSRSPGSRSDTRSKAVRISLHRSGVMPD